MICRVRPDMVKKLYKRIDSVISTSIYRDKGYTVDDALRQVIAEETQMWVCGDFEVVLITGIEVRPRSRELAVYFLSGSTFEEWVQPLKRHLFDFAKLTKCDAIEVNGRIGWKKYFQKDEDFKHTSNVYRAEVNG